MQLALIDWTLIGVYLLAVLAVGIWVAKKASSGIVSYFLADRSLPWIWTGSSIAATTFAADTPLAITGIIAAKGLSGNWIWLSWILLHVAVVFFFAGSWRRSAVLTDAELVALRYSGLEARALRYFKAALYAVVFNCIILGWVLKAMSKVVQPFFHWDQWLPGVYTWLSGVWPQDFVLGSPSEALTIGVLLALVGIYSTAGGIRGVILTDLFQLGIALFGSYWFAAVVLNAVGGLEGLRDGLIAHYGSAHQYLDLFPRTDQGWLGSIQLGYFGVGLYFLVQSYASNPADGGGYLMQRLGTSRDHVHAKKAALWFIAIQYVIRVWPWFVVGLAALVLIPIGQEGSVFSGAVAFVGQDREAAYPALMGLLLGPGAAGLVLVGLLAAFMSTVDTHINWGASYIVNDFFKTFFPNSTDRSQVRVARISVALFIVLAVFVASQISTIGLAWEWVAALGAGLGLPTALRWIWWRVNAWAEIGAMALGLFTAVVLGFVTDLPFEIRLLITAAAGLVGMGVGILLGPPTEEDRLREFVKRVEPMGFWPERFASSEATGRAKREFIENFVRALGMMTAVIFSLVAGQRVLMGQLWVASGFGFAAMALAVLSWKVKSPSGPFTRGASKRLILTRPDATAR